MIKTVDIISIGLLIILSFVALFCCSVYGVANVSFYILTAISVIEVLSKRSLSLDIVWIAGIMFIILPEMLFIEESSESVLSTSRFIILSNNLFLTSYYIRRPHKLFKPSQWEMKQSGSGFIILYLILLGAYCITTTPLAVLTMNYGRYTASQMFKTSLIGGVISDMGQVLPAFVAFYYRDKKRGLIKSFVLSFPIFAILVLCGTRFPLLFSLGGYVIASNLIKVYRIDRTSFIRIAALLACMGVLSTFMKVSRSGADYDDMSDDMTEYSVSQRICSYGSSEGVVNANVWLHDYCSKNGFAYGKQSSFFLYWFIPRQVWPNKPKMTGGWLPFLYGNYAEGHSASVGLWGELYVDYGYFCIILFILLGILMKDVNSFCEYDILMQSDNINVLKVALILPFVFFAVRSPITGMINLETNFALFIILRKITCVKK